MIDETKATGAIAPRTRPRRWLLALVAALCGCASTSDAPLADGDAGPAGDSGPTTRLDLGPLPDRGPVPKIGSNCQPVNTTVLYQGEKGRSGWLPRIAWSESQYGVVWDQETKETVGTTSMIRYYPAFVRVSPDGQPAGTAVQLSEQSTGRGMEPVAIAGLAQGRFAVVWGDSRQGQAEGNGKSDLYLRQIDAQGRPEGAGVKVTTSAAASYPYLVRPAFVGVEGSLDVRELAMAWRDGRRYEESPYGGSGRHDVYVKVLELDGKDKSDERRVTTDESRGTPFSPVLASDGNGYALVWKDTTVMTRTELFFTSLAADGTPRAAEQSLVTNRGLLSSSPDLVATGFEYGVGYSDNPTQDSGMIRFSRIDRAGAVMATQQVSAAGNPCTPAVAFNGERYALVWQDDCGQTGSKLVFAIIDDGGNPLKADGTSCFGDTDPRCGLITISPPDELAEGVAAYPEMISVGGKFAVTWMDAPLDRVYFSHVVCQQ